MLTFAITLSNDPIAHLFYYLHVSDQGVDVMEALSEGPWIVANLEIGLIKVLVQEMVTGID